MAKRCSVNIQQIAGKMWAVKNGSLLARMWQYARSNSALLRQDLGGNCMIERKQMQNLDYVARVTLNRNCAFYKVPMPLQTSLVVPAARGQINSKTL